MSIYKKTGNTYLLKMKNSRDLYSKVTNKFGSMPFNLRSLEDLARAKMGVVECVNHEILEPFQVLYERDGKTHYFEQQVQLASLDQGFNSEILC